MQSSFLAVVVLLREDGFESLVLELTQNRIVSVCCFFICSGIFSVLSHYFFSLLCTFPISSSWMVCDAIYGWKSKPMIALLSFPEWLCDLGKDCFNLKVNGAAVV